MATTAAAAIRSPTRAAAPGPAAPAQQRAVLRVASSRTSSARPRRAAAAVAAAAMQPAKAVAAEAASPAAALEMGNGAAVAGLQRPDAMGRFGRFGGKYVPETLMHALTELENAFHALATDDEFQVALPPRLLCLSDFTRIRRGIWMPSFRMYVWLGDATYYDGLEKSLCYGGGLISPLILFLCSLSSSLVH